MKVYIDQSGKFENTKNITIVAYYGTKSKSLKISAVEKRKILKVLKITSERKKLIVYEIFATLVYILVKSDFVTEMIIDDEYSGHGGSIKNFIKNYYANDKIKMPNVSFELITKKNPAHTIAINTFRGDRKADINLKAEDALSYLFRTKK